MNGPNIEEDVNQCLIRRTGDLYWRTQLWQALPKALLKLGLSFCMILSTYYINQNRFSDVLGHGHAFILSDTLFMVTCDGYSAGSGIAMKGTKSLETWNLVTEFSVNSTLVQIGCLSEVKYRNCNTFVCCQSLWMHGCCQGVWRLHTSAQLLCGQMMCCLDMLPPLKSQQNGSVHIPL